MTLFRSLDVQLAAGGELGREQGAAGEPGLLLQFAEHCQSDVLPRLAVVREDLLSMDVQ